MDGAALVEEQRKPGPADKGPVDTLRRVCNAIADYIAEHQDVADALSAAVGGKVDKVEGMGLSANDFTDALKAKLVERMYQVEERTELQEEKIKVANHRIEDLERRAEE